MHLQSIQYREKCCYFRGIHEQMNYPSCWTPESLFLGLIGVSIIQAFHSSMLVNVLFSFAFLF